MIANLKPYPSMKDSGVPWLGKVPQHWEVGALKRFAWFKSGAGFPVAEQGRRNYEIPFLKVSDMTRPGNEVWTEMTESTVSSATATRLGAFVFPAGSIIFPKVGGALLTNKRRLLRRPSCIDNNVMGCIVSEADINYAFILLQQLDLGRLAKPGPVPAIGEGEVRAIRGPLPPLPEQAAIVRFLDHADRRIRRYIRAKQKLIKLLEEQKQAIIHQAVTGQIDARTGQPYPAYKPSGVEWLGEVPEHWAVASLRHRYSQCLGKMLDSKRITGRHLLPYLRNTDIQWDRINIEDLPTMDISPNEYDRYTVQPGDLLVCEGGEIGRCALWSDEPARYGFQKALHRLRPRNEGQDVARFMYYALRAAAKGHAFNDGHLSTIAHLTGDKLRTHRFPFPNFPEQAAIVRYLDKTTAYIDTAIVRAGRQIELLQEYRTRLIADVVTGKLDVREAAAGLPEVDPFADKFDALPEATETGVMEREDANELPEEPVMENEATI